MSTAAKIPIKFLRVLFPNSCPRLAPFFGPYKLLFEDTYFLH